MPRKLRFFWRRKSGIWHVDTNGRTRCLNCASLTREFTLHDPHIGTYNAGGLPGRIVHTSDAMTCCDCGKVQ